MEPFISRHFQFIRLLKSMRAYNKIELEKVARETGFIRDNLEKVIRLSNILEFLVSNDDLKGKVVLKGGTAINL